MIHYNMRYRGTYEYEKFVLNYMQYYNQTNDMINDLSLDSEDSIINKLNSLIALSKTYENINDSLYNKLLISQIGEKK